MAKKRKDHKNRVLHDGESQRKDLTYQYRFTDNLGKRRTVYARTLEDLRKKEQEIRKDLEFGLNYADGRLTVNELLERYISLKNGVRYNTKVGYQTVVNMVKKDPFGERYVKDIKVSDAKRWFLQLHENGKGYSTITNIRGVVKPAFQMAVDEDIILKNPFLFKITDVIPNDSERRIALTEEQQKLWMDFMHSDKTYSKYYDEMVILLETGIRVSEFCGLTKNDLDFENRYIRVDHQLVRERGGKYYVEKTKTESGCRRIPMTDNVYHSLKRILAGRKKLRKEPVIDGYGGFLLIDKNGRPKVSLHIENEIRWGLEKYHKLHPDKPLPHITPHVLRHTFCTNMANAGMDLKNLQYLMGHSDASVTMNVYTHPNYDRAAEQLRNITEFGSVYRPNEQRKMG